MKISAINFYNPQKNKQFNLNQSGEKHQSQMTSTLPLSSIPLSCLNSFTISFNGLVPNLPYNAHDIPCICCGIKMVPRAFFEKKLNEKTLEGPSKKAVKALLPFQDNMHEIERKCFEKIKTASEKSPNKTLQEIMRELRPESIKLLRTNEFDILNKIDSLGRTLPPQISKSVREFISLTKRIILADNPQYPFKRKKFIAILSDIISQIPPEQVTSAKTGEEIIQTASSLNDSTHSLHSYIVKYSGTSKRIKDGKKVYELRSSKEIGQRLVSTSIITDEHIIPQHSIEGLNGTDEPKNIALECAACNNNRGNKPWAEHVADSPNMPKIAQQHYDVLIVKMNRGEIVGYENGLKEVVATLDEASDGAIKIDISNLKKSNNQSMRT